ncbi:MAG: RNA polymerase sigma factor RpoD/SigA [Candidatus Orphnella occulta]|nr:RNA polymerase sigma factor RpoD/SigA [Candidatus Orphnella occulta]
MFNKNVLMLYFKDIEAFPLLSHEEEIKLAGRIKRKDSRASKIMVQSNLRLVVNIAKRYAYTGLPMLDIIEEGNIGLMKAVKKYDPGRGYRFSTYAAWWIRQYIMRAIANQGKTIRVPVYMVETIIRYKKVIEELKHKYKRDPAASEIAKRMKLSARKIGQIAQAAQSQPTSMETPIGEEQGGKFLELIEDESAQLPDERMSDALRDESIRKLLDELDPRDKKVLMFRFGLDEKKTLTLQEIAKKLKITKERVRQIEKRAIDKLKKLVVDQGIKEGMKAGDIL